MPRITTGRPVRRTAGLLLAAALLIAACGTDIAESSASPGASGTSSTTVSQRAGDEASTGGGGGDEDDRPDAGPTDDPEARSTESTEPTAGTPSERPTDAGDGSEEHDDDGPDAGDDAADLTIDGSLLDGQIRIDDRRFEVPVGSRVRLTFESDTPEHLHLHGHDLLVDLTPGEPAELVFVADSPGTFEVELEDSGRFLFELLVR